MAIDLNDATELKTDELDLKSPEFYLNRELSWLQFNRRVLDLALDPSMPVLERLKFLCISSTNLDEFFEVRVARLKHQILGESLVAGPDGLSPAEQLRLISQVTHTFVSEQYKAWNDVVLPALENAGIRFARRTAWNEKQRRWIKRYFNQQVLPVLSPLGLDPSHPFPRILNKSLNFIVSLEGNDSFARDSGIAIVQAPRSLPRIIQLPKSVARGEYDFVFLSSIIHAHVGDLFPGMKVKGCHQFRVTRNSDLFVDEEEIDDLRRALEDELFQRHYGDAVRLEVADNCPDDITSFLRDQFKLQPEDCYQVNGPVNVNRLMALADMVARPDLKFPPFVPGIPRDVARRVDIFEAIRNRDILLHHPFESFTPVVDFIKQAAADPDVLAIKLTLYRTDVDSALPEALIEAAHSGKEVTAIIELRARFDEEKNIKLANRLEHAGAHVVYGVVGYKTHAKMSLVVRREGGRLRRYAHLGTGNYHPKTSRLYTDFGLLTADADICADVHKMFNQLTGLGRAMRLKKLKQAPFVMHKWLLEMIDREAEAATAGKPARIIAKMNSLTEPEIIRALYRASRAGVQIDLIIRGVCCLRPGIADVSSNIRVRSIVGRFLEHSRAYYFKNGDPQVYISSGDWMNRNLFRRIEETVAIEDPRLSKRVLDEGFNLYLKDNTQTWMLGADGQYVRSTPGNATPVNAQLELLDDHADTETLAPA
ncbi:MAG: polyphosphate kinase 1 [bacterium]